MAQLKEMGQETAKQITQKKLSRPLPTPKPAPFPKINAKKLSTARPQQNLADVTNERPMTKIGDFRKVKSEEKYLPIRFEKKADELGIETAIPKVKTVFTATEPKPDKSLAKKLFYQVANAKSEEDAKKAYGNLNEYGKKAFWSYAIATGKLNDVNVSEDFKADREVYGGADYMQPEKILAEHEQRIKKQSEILAPIRKQSEKEYEAKLIKEADIAKAKEKGVQTVDLSQYTDITGKKGAYAPLPTTQMGKFGTEFARTASMGAYDRALTPEQSAALSQSTQGVAGTLGQIAGYIPSSVLGEAGLVAKGLKGTTTVGKIAAGAARGSIVGTGQAVASGIGVKKPEDIVKDVGLAVATSIGTEAGMAVLGKVISAVGKKFAGKVAESTDVIDEMIRGLEAEKVGQSATTVNEIDDAIRQVRAKRADIKGTTGKVYSTAEKAAHGQIREAEQIVREIEAEKYYKKIEADASAKIPQSKMAPKIDFTASINAGEDDIKKGLVKNISYDPSLRNEATYFDGKIKVGNKFFDLPSDSKKSVLSHEISHSIAEQMNNDQQMIMADVVFRDIYNNRVRYEKIIGEPAWNKNYDEVVTDLISSYYENPTTFKSRYPDAFELAESIVSGKPIQNTTIYKNASKESTESVTAPELPTPPKTVAPKQPIPLQKPIAGTKPLPTMEKPSMVVQKAKNEELAKLEAEYKQSVDSINKSNLNEQEKASRLKGLAMSHSSEKRKLIQGDSLEKIEGGLTPSELKKAIEKEKSNYYGKKVNTPDGEGIATGQNSFGKVGVQLKDGTVKYYAKEAVNAVEKKIPIAKPEVKPTQEKPTMDNVAPKKTIPLNKPVAKSQKPTIKTKVSQFRTNTIERAENIPDEIKTNVLKPSHFDYIPETVEEWNTKAIQNVANNADEVKSRIERMDSIPGGVVAEEAAILSEKLLKEAEKTGNYAEYIKFSQTVAERTRGIARELRATDTAWQKSPKNAVNKLVREVDNANAEIKAKNPKVFQKIDKQVNEVKQLYKDLPNDKAKIQQMIDDLERIKAENPKSNELFGIELQLFAAKQKMKSFRDAGSTFDEKYITEFIKKKYGVPTIETAEIKQVIDLIKKANAETDARMKQTYTQKAGRIISNKKFSTLGEHIQALQRISLIFNPKSLIARNPLGNVILGVAENVKDAPGTLIDAATTSVLKKLGLPTQRTTALSIEGLQAQLKGAGKGLDDWWWDVKNKVNTSESAGMLEIPQKRIFKNEFLNSIDQAERILLQLGDRPSYEAAKQGRLVELKKLGRDITSDEAIAEAKAYALDRTFQNMSKTAEGAKMLKTAINRFTGGVGGEIILPFTQTPANVFDKLLDYSPVGLGKAINQLGSDIHYGKLKSGEFNQKLFVDRLGRSITGTGLAILGAAMYAKGLITTSLSTDEDVRDVQQRTGMQDYSLNVNGKSYTINWANPIAGTLIAGAEAYKASEKDKKSFLESIGSGAFAAGDSMLKQSFLQNVLKVLQNKQSPTEGLVNTLIGGGTQAVPTVLGQVAQISDKYARDTSGKNIGEKVLNQMKSKIPGLRQTLPIKTDVYGKPIELNQGRDIVSRTFDTFLNPGFYAENKGSEVDKELLRLNKATNEKDFFPKVISADLKKYTKEPIALTPEQRNELQSIVGPKIFEEYKRIMNTSSYKMARDVVPAYTDSLSKQKILNRAMNKIIDTETAKWLRSKGYRTR